MSSRGSMFKIPVCFLLRFGNLMDISFQKEGPSFRGHWLIRDATKANPTKDKQSNESKSSLSKKVENQRKHAETQ